MKGQLDFEHCGKCLQSTNDYPIIERIMGHIEKEQTVWLYTSKAKRYYSKANWALLLEGKPVRGKVMVGGGK